MNKSLSFKDQLKRYLSTYLLKQTVIMEIKRTSETILRKDIDLSTLIL